MRLTKRTNGLPEILDVTEAGDAYLDHTGRFVEGQQLTMFGVPPPDAKRATQPSRRRGGLRHCGRDAGSDRVLRDVDEPRCQRASAQTGRRENHHAALNLAYGRATGRRGALSTPAEYRAKGDWMKRRYMEFLG